MPTPNQLLTPVQSDVRRIYGEPGSAQATAGMVDLPYPMRVAWDTNQVIRKFRCHAKVEKACEAIFQQTLAHYGEAQVKALGLDLFAGCYNFRQMRGSKAWSMHAFGIAVDIDSANNQLKWNHTKARFAKPDYEAYWKIVEAEGATSLGRAKDYDWMHFQFARV